MKNLYEILTDFLHRITSSPVFKKKDEKISIDSKPLADTDSAKVQTDRPVQPETDTPSQVSLSLQNFVQDQPDASEPQYQSPEPASHHLPSQPSLSTSDEQIIPTDSIENQSHLSVQSSGSISAASVIQDADHSDQHPASSVLDTDYFQKSTEKSAIDSGEKASSGKETLFSNEDLFSQETSLGEQSAIQKADEQLSDKPGFLSDIQADDNSETDDELLYDMVFSLLQPGCSNQSAPSDFSHQDLSETESSCQDEPFSLNCPEQPEPAASPDQKPEDIQPASAKIQKITAKKTSYQDLSAEDLSAEDSFAEAENIGSLAKAQPAESLPETSAADQSRTENSCRETSSILSCTRDLFPVTDLPEVHICSPRPAKRSLSSLKVIPKEPACASRSRSYTISRPRPQVQPEERPCFPLNGKQTMLQGFEWYTTEDGSWWRHLSADSSRLENDGYTMVWMPPAYKGQAGVYDVGYGVYDMYDLGEFDQKGTIRTKYGTREEYLQAIHDLQTHHIKTLADIVVDHRMGADSTEEVSVHNVDSFNRNNITSGCYQAEVWCHFDFPNRQGKYSQFVWNASCFNSADFDAHSGRGGVMLFDGKSWNQNVSHEYGNYDYVMGLCSDFHAPWVVKELHDWGKWYVEQTHIDGFRLDCLKSIDYTFFEDWLKDVHQMHPDNEQPVVGEYWSGDPYELQQYLEHTHRCMKLFDVPLHYHLFDCSKSGGRYDVRTLFDNTLTQWEPDHSVAFVDNHDTQPTQALCSWVEDWFKTSAYACILLYRAKTPCVFWGDKEGIPRTGNQPVSLLEEMVWIRAHLMGDEIIDLFDDDWQKGCWMIKGMHPVIVIFTIGDHKEKRLWDADLHDEDFTDIARPDHHVHVSHEGDAIFDCDAGCCSVYIPTPDYQLMQRALY